MNSTKILITNIVVILVIIIGGFTGYYFYNQSTMYLKTDNAQVTGKQLVIAAPASGAIANWKGKVGTAFKAGDTVGDVEVVTGQGTQDVKIEMPADGTIVQSSASDHEFVAPGTPLAYAYDMNDLWVTANINETDLNEVKVGQTVDVYVDAFPNVTLSGTVSQIGLATAGSFSLLPQNNNNANYTKVTQVVPVSIALSNSQGVKLVPGMSVEVRIHK